MKKLYHIFLLLSRGRQIGLVVSLIHTTAILALVSHHLISGRLKPQKPMAVRTISLAPPKEKIAAAPVAPKPSPIKKTTAAAPVAPAPKKKESKSVLKEINETFSALSSEPKKKPRSALNIPSKIDPKNAPIEESSDDGTYSEYLVAYLQNVLDLPEHGEVKMELEIDAGGKLINCRTLQSKSAKNAQFLKDELALLTFPQPLDIGRREKSKKYCITFKNQ